MKLPNNKTQPEATDSWAEVVDGEEQVHQGQ